MLSIYCINYIIISGILVTKEHFNIVFCAHANQEQACVIPINKEFI